MVTVTFYSTDKLASYFEEQLLTPPIDIDSGYNLENNTLEIRVHGVVLPT